MTSEPAPAQMAQAMFDVSAITAVWHDWLAGEVAYFERQGHPPEHARAMAAAEFMTAFGSNLPAVASKKGEPG